MRSTRILTQVTRVNIHQKLSDRLRKFTELKKQSSSGETSLDSVLAEGYIKSNDQFDSYKRFSAQKAKVESEVASSSKELSLPFSSGLEKIQKAERIVDEVVEETVDKLSPDRGFYVKEDKFSDEYIAALASDIPDDEMNDVPYTFHNVGNAVELIDFQAPNQETAPKGKSRGSQNDLELSDGYGKADPSFQHSEDINCSGCGAKFHCADTSLPGFIPVNLLQKLVRWKKKSPQRDIFEHCRRCYMLKKYNFLLNVNVSTVDYRRVMGHLKLVHDALIVLVVDMTDIRGSLFTQLPQLIGSGKSVIVVGNKVDLLPPDSREGYFKNFKSILEYELNKAGSKQDFHIVKTHLISAKTGYGIEDLITSIYMEWIGLRGSVRSDIYLVGCTNAGKSTLFNSFLQSDLCKVRAQDLVERVSTSIWPGTTLSLLKFPIMNPSPRKQELRRRRLISQMSWKKKEASFQRQLFNQTRDPKYLSLSGMVGSTFKEEESELQSVSEENLIKRLDNNFDELEETKKEKPKISLSHATFREGVWCYDTPGTVNSDQILDLLTLDELVNVLPKSLIVPQTAVLHENFSLLIGGLARIDIVDVAQNQLETENRPVYLTVFAGASLPVEVLPTSQVDEYLSDQYKQNKLGAPFGDQNRLDQLPELKSETYKIRPASRRFLKGSTDILLSSVGWVLVSSIHPVTLKAYTPDARGLGLRPPMTPNAVHMKGSRIAGTRLFTPKIQAPQS